MARGSVSAPARVARGGRRRSGGKLDRGQASGPICRAYGNRRIRNFPPPTNFQKMEHRAALDRFRGLPVSWAACCSNRRNSAVRMGAKRGAKPYSIDYFCREHPMDLINKSIVITGGGGFLGRHVVAHFRQEGC